MRIHFRLLRVGVGLALLGCNHTEPFGATDYRSVGPLLPGSPTRLTYDSGVDTRASWLPNGTAFIYTQEQFHAYDDDRCLAVMPKTGGTTARTICALNDPDQDTLDDFESAAVSPAGRLAYVRTSMRANVGRYTPDYAALVLTSFASPDSFASLLHLPYIGPSGQGVDGITDPHWLDPSTLIFVANQVTYACANVGCTQVDTSVTPVEIERLDVTTGNAQPTVVASTAGATCLSVVGTDTIYYAFNGDSLVHRRILSSNADTVVFNFGPGAVTGVSVARGRMAATVSGALHVVTLGSASDQVLLSGIVSHPAFDPTGHLLVADYVPIPAPATPPDLWLWTIP